MARNRRKRYPDDYLPHCRRQKGPKHSSTNTAVFHRFMRLPTEIRLMIWELSWPAPRVIETVTYHELPDSDAILGFNQDSSSVADPESTTYRYTHGYVRLQLLGSLAFFNSRYPDKLESFEDWYVPASLHVCRESRHHALRHFVWMSDPEDDWDSFFFNPRRDVLSLPGVLSDSPIDEFAELRGHYGTQLDHVQTVVLEEFAWELPDGPRQYCTKLRSILGGIQSLRIVLMPLDCERSSQVIQYAKDYALRDVGAIGDGFCDWNIDYTNESGEVFHHLDLSNWP